MLSSVTVVFIVIAVVIVGVCIANCIYMKRHPATGELGEGLLNRNFLDFMPGLNRRDVQEQTLEMERWECSVCAFLNIATKPMCKYRLIEMYSESVPSESPSLSVSHRASKTFQRQTSKSLQRLSSFFHKAILPEDLNPRQRSARMRKQWTRQMDAKGRVVWARHFLDTEEFPASFVIQMGPIHTGGNYTDDSTSVTVIIHDSTTLASADGYSPPTDFTKTIAWVPIEAVHADAAVTGARLALSMWTSLLAISRLPFSLKYAWFLHQIEDLIVPYGELCALFLIASAHPSPISHVQTKVDRARVFEEALENLMLIKEQGLCAIIRYTFLGESGLDAGAIQREWYMLVAQALLHEDSGLFAISNREDNSYFINPNSAHATRTLFVLASRDTSFTRVHRNVALPHLDLYRAAGRFIGRALLDGQVLPIHLNPVLFKALLGVPMTLDDIEALDRTTYKSLQYLVQNDKVDELSLTFSVTQPLGDGYVEVDLVPHGSDIAVTDANKHEYIELMVRHLVFGRVEPQLLAIIKGLYDVIPSELLTAFDHKELELILCGLNEIDVADWQANTVTSSNLEKAAVLEWFWDVVAGLSVHDQAKLLQYATGASRVPVQGFKGLTSYDGKICYFTLKGIVYAPGMYPVAHACYNRIDLPLYPERALLEEAIATLLLSDPTGFNIEYGASDGGNRTLWFFGLCASVVLFVLFLGIVNYCYSKRYGSPTPPGPAVNNQNFHEFMPGIKRGDVEELLAKVDRWECSICAFQSVVQKQSCSLCGTPKDARLVEVSTEQVVPRKTRSSSVMRRSSMAGPYRHRSKSGLPRPSMRRLSLLFQKAILPEDLNARQRSARCVSAAHHFGTHCSAL
ncbi:HECT E3 ubiquitin ligase [Achlya hypogyna]|uniref:HECT-type E3 ubiquitin transferase n=1 Tax=Achlya hypogyna TaxID=1202772 RepID=A0A1V9ZN74_ACHHY|nr:HECT E3 ubiquitin ligase [Achlya hypogyna]